jgi:hypothetical protein
MTILRTSWAACAAAISIGYAPGLMAQSAPQPVQLHLLEQLPPGTAEGVSWGVPWPQGAVAKDTQFNLTDSAGNSLALQAWPLAYWPDGSLKWTGFASVAPAGTQGVLTLAAGSASASSAGLKVTQNDQSITINTGPLECVIARGGQNLVDSIRVGGREVARDGTARVYLAGRTRDHPRGFASPRKIPRVRSRKVTVEQSGPVRAVVKIEGVHRNEKSGREWLPFTVRLYFLLRPDGRAPRAHHRLRRRPGEGFRPRPGPPIRRAHARPAANRTVRFAGEDGGLWSEPLQPGGGSVAQEAGQPFRPAAGGSTRMPSGTTSSSPR